MCVYMHYLCILLSTGTIPLKYILCMQKCIYHSPMTGFLHFYNDPDFIFAVLLAVVPSEFP